MNISDIEAEEDYIAILNDILLALKAELSSFPDMCLRAILDEIINAVNLCLDKTLLEIRMDYSCALRSLRAFMEGPCPVLIGTCGEESPETQRLICCTDKRIEAALSQTRGFEELLPVLLALECCNLALDL